ncbi:MAG: hypothetical protein C5B52_07910 [Bacteroidetes bacterium]|nr:MAG: hypothetical protein C5B52_07910 [Bacteroidota bacterium]
MNTQSKFKMTAKVIMTLILISGTVFTLRAQFNFPNEPNEKTAVINYLGYQDQMLLFYVQYENNNASKFFVTIRQEDGTTIFQDAFSDKKFEKRFRVPIQDSHKLTFTISDRKSNYTQAFEIKASSRVVEDISVHEIDQK